jgi:N-acetylglucosaminyldiphosphoundecaprenol N-acetyl-beta-D-mannosaminyltransferase
MSVSAPQGWAQRWRRILERLRLVLDPGAEQALLQELAGLAAQASAPRVLAFVNAHALNLAVRDRQFAEQLAGADLLLRDGSGLALLLRWLGRAAGRNLNGTDFIPRLLRACDGQALAVIGTRPPYLQRGAGVIAAQLMPRSGLWTAEGFATTEHYRELLQAHRPPLVLLAMGMPRQEAVALELRATLGYPCLIVCGGAIVDFLAGRVRRAPPWLRRLGLEWLWRLGQEPRRLFLRYVVGNPLFLWRAVRLARGRS